MLPRQPACSSHAVGSIITTSSAASGSRSSSGASADSGGGQLLAAEEQAAVRARRRARARSSRRARPSCRSRRARARGRRRSGPGRLSCAGTVSRWPGEQDRRVVGPASTHVSPRSRTGTPPARSTAGDVGGEAGLVARLRRDVDELQRPGREALTEGCHGPHNSLRTVRYCGVDVSAKAGQPAARDAARAARADGGGARGDVLRARHAGGGRPHDRRASDAAGGRRRRRAVRAAPGPARGAAAPLRAALGLPDGRYERMRVCDALLFRRGLPLYPVPPAGQAPTGWEEWIGVGFAVFDALADLGLYRPDAADGAVSGPVGRDALRLRPPVRDVSRRGVLHPARPPPVAEAHAVGRPAAHRRAAGARASRTPTAGSGTARSTSSTPAPPPMPRMRSPPGRGSWVGAPAEGVSCCP